MPLFGFQYFEHHDFSFSDGRLSIRKFEDTGNLANREIFSEQDRQDIVQARKALVADSNDIRGYDLDANLLLMAFRVLSDHLTPFIKYRLSDDKNLRFRIMDVETHILLQGYRYESYTIQDFPRVDAVYMAFRHAEHVSLRLKNAFFFVYLAFTTVHWMESFLFHMNALEALFSRDERGPATKTITKRVSSFLDDTTNWSEKTISDLYEVRSRITHGTQRCNRQPPFEREDGAVDQTLFA